MEQKYIQNKTAFLKNISDLSILFLLQNNILQKVSNNYREKIVHRK